MLVTKRAFLALIACLFLSTQSYGLGLAELTIHSKLGQPLYATASLLDTGNLDASQIKAVQAAPQLYKKFGVDPIARQQPLRFTISEQHPMVLTIRSSEPVTEPLLHLLLQIRWPDGQLVKELTVLLDPPAH